MLRLVRVAVLLALASLAVAWGPAGHRITAQIAARYYFDNATLLSVTKLLENNTWWEYTPQWVRSLFLSLPSRSDIDQDPRERLTTLLHQEGTSNMRNHNSN